MDILEGSSDNAFMFLGPIEFKNQDTIVQAVRV